MFQILLYFLFVVMIGLFLGIFVGMILSDLRFQNGVKAVVKAFLRVTQKKWLRSINPDIDVARIQRDQLFLALQGNERVGMADARAIEAVAELKQRLFCLFGNQIEAIFLFGSRARGDYQPDSDVDVGIFLADFGCSNLLKKELLCQSSELLLKYGLFIQPRILDQYRSRNGIGKPENYLAQIVINYGILI